MNIPWVLLAALVATVPSFGQSLSRRANITGSRGDHGKCTIEVEVDGAADIEISGDQGVIRTLAGRTAVWRRFQCTDPLPRNPTEFRFSGIDGRGRQTLLRDPRGGRGVAVVRIEDHKGGREGYTFDLEWRGNYNSGGGGYPGSGGGFGRPGRDGFSRAVDVCSDAATSKIRGMGYRDVNIYDAAADNKPGRNDWIIGRATGRRGNRGEEFTFGCSVDFSNGRVRSVDVKRR